MFADVMGDLCSDRPPGVDLSSGCLARGLRAVIAESLLLKHQLLILNPSRKRAPKLRVLFGIGAFLISPQRVPKIAILIRPATLLRFTGR
jgi:hypothetical protein